MDDVCKINGNLKWEALELIIENQPNGIKWILAQYKSLTCYRGYDLHLFYL